MNEAICKERTATQWRAVAAQTTSTGAIAQAQGCAALVERLAGTGGQGQAEQQQPPLPAEAKLVRGKVGVVRQGEQQERPLEGDGTLKPGDTVVTKAEGAVLSFEGGSRIEAGPNAEFTLQKEGGAVEQKKGRVFYSIVDRRMTVHVPAPRGRYFIAVKGTQFTVDVADDGAGTVEVMEGTVEVTSAGATVTVNAGSSLRVQPGEVPPQPTASIEAQRTVSTAVVAGAVAAVSIAVGLVALVLTRRARQRASG